MPQPNVPDTLARIAAALDTMRQQLNLIDGIIGGLPRSERIDWSRQLIPLRAELDALTDLIERKAGGQ